MRVRMTQDPGEWLERARTARAGGRPAEARAALERALALCQNQPELDVALLAVLRALAQLERDEGRLEAAADRYQAAVAVCRRGASSNTLAHTVRHLADLYRTLGRLDEAEPLYVEALALYRAETGVSRLDLANTVRPYALLAQRLGRSAEARRLWQEARALYAEAGVSEGVAEADAQLQRLEARRGSVEQGGEADEAR